MTSTTRREFLRAGLGTGAALALSPGLFAAPAPCFRPPAAPKKLLILGGTRFLGPQVVRAAQEGGWHVTLFNRGRSNPELFPELEKLRGDRDRNDLDALKGGRWDVVVDTSGYVPAHVRAAAEILADRVGLYVFISTISVYADPSVENLDEEAPVLTLEPSEIEAVRTMREVSRHYGALKAYCEKAAEEVMPGRVAAVRPGLIVGPEDGSDRFTYWPVRVKRGGEILAPGVPDGEVQFIDVRDLGEWTVTVADRQVTGTYNAVGFRGRLSMEELLHGCKIVTGSEASFTWVSESFLQENQVRPYLEMPLWLPDAYRGHVDNRRAIARGLAFRPVGDTIEATLAWHEANRGPDHEWTRAGMKPDREAELLAKWKSAAGANRESGE
jgi:2'-hydroxyisoflavone reductase